MNTKLTIVLLGLTAAVTAQTSNPKWAAPTKGTFVELTAYNLAGYTPQQLWGYRHVERVVKFDSGLNCVYESQKSMGAEQSYSAVCWGK